MIIHLRDFVIMSSGVSILRSLTHGGLLPHWRCQAKTRVRLSVKLCLFNSKLEALQLHPGSDSGSASVSLTASLLVIVQG